MHLFMPRWVVSRRNTMIGELLSGMAHSTGPGFVGVSLIFIYLAWILTIGIIRVKEAMNEDHH